MESTPEEAVPWIFDGPVAGRLSSPYGLRLHPLHGGFLLHRGVDVAARQGTPAQAIRSGQVTFAGWRGGYGRLVEIDHGLGWRSRYAHLDQIHVILGMTVQQGDCIGTVGQSGQVTGPHLHFEIEYAGETLDPLGIFFGMAQVSDEPRGQQGLGGPCKDCYNSMHAVRIPRQPPVGSPFRSRLE